MTQKEKVLKDFESLEKRRLEILEEVKQLDNDKLYTSPKPGSWSVSQALRHIQLAESGSLAYLQHKAKSGFDDMPRPTLKAVFLLWSIKMLFQSGLKFKAPKTLPEPQNSSIDELEKDWTITRKDIRSFIENLPEEAFSKALYRHPFAGRLSMEKGIWFFDFHLAHHYRQVKRIPNQL